MKGIGRCQCGYGRYGKGTFTCIWLSEHEPRRGRDRRSARLPPMGTVIGSSKTPKKKHAKRTACLVQSLYDTAMHAVFKVIYIDRTAPASVAATSQPGNTNASDLQ